MRGFRQLNPLLFQNCARAHLVEQFEIESMKVLFFVVSSAIGQISLGHTKPPGTVIFGLPLNTTARSPPHLKVARRLAQPANYHSTLSPKASARASSI